MVKILLPFFAPTSQATLHYSTTFEAESSGAAASKINST
jgi:hypothetical protein